MNHTETKRFQINLLSCICQIVSLFIIGRIIGDRGVTYLAITLEVFFLLMALLNGGIIDSLGALLVARKEKSQYKNNERMRRCALNLQLVVGLVFGVLLFVLADVLAIYVFKTNSMAFLLRTVSFLIPVRLLASTYLGFYKGEGRPFDAAYARMFRAGLTLLLTVILVGVFGNYGAKVGAILNQVHIGAMYQSVAVLIAMLISEIFVLVTLAILYEKKIKERISLKDGMRLTESKRQCLGILFQTRIPSVLTQLIMVSPMLLAFLYWNKFSGKIDGFLFYGTYVGEFGFLVVLIAIANFVFLLPLLQLVKESLEKKDVRFAKTKFHLGLHSCFVNGIFAAVFGSVMSKQIAAVFSPSSSKITEQIYSASSTSFLFATVGIYLFLFLIMNGLQRRAIVNVGITAIIYLSGMFILFIINKPFTLFPAIWTMICLMFACVAMWKAVARYIRVRIYWMGAVVIPLGVGCFTGLICLLFSKLFTPHLGNLFTLIMTFLIANVLYWFGLLLLRDFRENEVKYLPAGKVIHFFAKVFRLF